MKEDEYQIGNIEFDRICAVCGKPVKLEDASAHLKVEDGMISICCPLCYETYQKKPDYFLAMRALRIAQERSGNPGATGADG